MHDHSKNDRARASICYKLAELRPASLLEEVEVYGAFNTCTDPLITTTIMDNNMQKFLETILRNGAFMEALEPLPI